MDKKTVRLRRARRTREKIKATGATRLCVYKTPRHMYAQIIAPATQGAKVLASASTLDKQCRVEISHGGNIAAAKIIGRSIAERAKAAGITSVAFDRSGFKYHGCVKALAESARENGLNF